jgi:hypothetical protein
MIYDVAGDPHRKNVTQSDIEDNFRRGSRIRARQNRGEGALRVRYLAASRWGLTGMLEQACHKTAIAF